MASESTSVEAPSKAKLAELTAAANLQYSLKNYIAAADLFSEATELQAELNGEMAPENADLLYQYGRCLFKVAVAKSDVLGGKVTSEEKPDKRSAKKPKAQETEMSAGTSKANGADGHLESGSKEDSIGSKPYFQLTGDENWTDSEDSDDADGEPGAEADAEDDDFANAYEILDFGRILLSRQLEMLTAASAATGQGKGKSIAVPKTEDTPEIRHVKERLADTHDLQAEISLENERFTDAISDTRAALELRQQLYPPESSFLAEAHYKLSLALEFASVTAVREAQREQGTAGGEAAEVDMELRREAGVEMEAAIESLELRLKKEQAELSSLSGEKQEKHQRSIDDAKEMLDEMKQRLHDLRADPKQTNPLAVLGDSADPVFGGLLGSILGADPAAQKARIEEAAKNANDLSNLVRHKKKAPTEDPKNDSVNGSGSGSSKRKLEVEKDGERGAEGKRAKTEEVL
ncbi:hypothetical protein K432DRAFT_362740 [Lepidopterella palustris CBS 459.81]|uniref:Tetratricopeptide SHNi-TPR domain-containing protein n=1 Tax=Lepidopterella palustris CBS 459.81 TaxID=1314670 RepID=A0A8E2E0E5_9PEZI|nr:hypothetical protein K432DRAFT_362740 [Lepidopterella palustris CBS 459.81]